MAIVKEVKTGIIGVILFVGILVLINIIKKNKTFSTDMIITAKFDRVNFAKVGQPVYLQGKAIGKISAIYKVQTDLFVDMELEAGTLLPPTTKASIYTQSILSGVAIALSFEAPCQGNCLQTGDQITGTLDDLQRVAERKAMPYLLKLDTFTSQLVNDTTGLEILLDNAFTSLDNLAKTSDNWTKMMKQKEKSLPVSLHSLQNSSSELATKAKNNTLLDSMIYSLASLSSKDIKEQTKILYTTNEQLKKINPIFAKANKEVSSTNTKLDKVNKMLPSHQKGGNSSMAKLLHDSELKDSTQVKIQKISTQLEDIRNNPQKYLSLKK